MIRVIYVFPPYLTSEQTEVNAKTPCPCFKVGHQLLILTRLPETSHCVYMQKHFWVTCDIVLSAVYEADIFRITNLCAPTPPPTGAKMYSSVLRCPRLCFLTVYCYFLSLCPLFFQLFSPCLFLLFFPPLFKLVKTPFLVYVTTTSKNRSCNFAQTIKWTYSLFIRRGMFVWFGTGSETKWRR